jgi:Coenzyme PQQ synthesis protein D (PqqD)
MSQSKKEEINYLDLTPEYIHGYEIKENGKVSILIPRFTSKFFGKYFMPLLKNKFIPLKLDEFGSETWLLIDGKKNVLAICDVLTEKFGEKIHPTEERVTSFLSHLYTNKFIRFIELNKN